MDLDYVGVGERGRASRLALKALHKPLVLGVLLPQDFERHIAAQDLVTGQVDLRHATLTQRTQQLVTTIENDMLHVSKYTR